MQSFSIVKYKEVVSNFPHKGGYNPNHRIRKITTKEQYDQWLIDSPKIGDAIVYEAMKVEPNNGVIQIVIDIVTEFSQVEWDTYTGYPKSHKVLAVASIAYNWPHSSINTRFVTPNEYRVITEEEYKKAIDDQLQDNIARAIESLE